MHLKQLCVKSKKTWHVVNDDDQGIFVVSWHWMSYHCVLYRTLQLWRT